MHDLRVQFALDNFIEEDYFLPMAEYYQLKEEKESGKSNLNVRISNENLCVYDFDHKHTCSFLRQDKQYGMQKTVDHILFEKKSDKWLIHLIEMKSGVGYKTWLEHVKPKVRSSYLNAQAIAEFLGIHISEIIAYTTYSKEKFLNEENAANLKARTPMLGMAAREPYYDEWEKDCMYLNLGEELKISHKRIKMKRNEVTGVLEGMLELS